MKKIITLCLAAMLAGNLFAQQQKIDSLINVLETQKLSNKEQILLYRTICVHYGHSDVSKLLEYCNRGLRVAEKENDTYNMSLFNEMTGFYYESLFKYDSAHIYYTKALNIATENQDITRESQVYLSLGAMYFMQEQYVSALDYFMNAEEISNKLENKATHVYVLGNIGTIHYNMKNYDMAIPFFEQALTVAEGIPKYPKLKINPMYYLGIIYREKKEFDKALEYTQNVLDIAITINEKTDESAALQSLANIYMSKIPKDYKKAMEYASESLRIAEETGYSTMISSALYVISNIYKEQKQWKLCDETACKAWETDSINTGSGVFSNILSNIVLANIYLNDNVKAEFFFNKFYDHILKSNDKSLHNSVLDMQTKYETEKKEMEINELRKERTLYTWIVAVSLVAVLLILCLLYFRQRLNKQKIKQLEQDKQLIASQAVIDGEAAERTRLARDLHDGLGGMLSVVKLNLNDLKGYSLIENTDVNNFNRAVEMLDKSIAELRRVSHHIMPDLSAGLKTPLEDFCRSIPEANFRFFGDDSHLDNRLKITVYRCLHELINNAIKHARATVINVQLMIENNLISLSVQDDGIGFAPDTVVKGLGLENIRARVEIYKGKVNIFSSPEKGGTEVSIEIELGG